MPLNPPPTTWAVSRDDPVAWRRGRKRYGVWVLDVDTAAVRERLAAARALLGDWLWPTARQPHLTVWVGGFLCEAPLHPDDLPPALLAAQQARLQAAPPPPFELWLGAPQTFDAAAYLQVHDRAGALARLRTLLQLQDGHRGEFRDTPYVPHVTIGLYRQAVPRADVIRRLGAWREAALALPVTALRFVSYEAAVIDGPLRCEWTQPLGR